MRHIRNHALERQSAAVLDSFGIKCDANEVAAFSRQLEHVRSTTYDAEFGPRKARELIPLDTSVPTWAETYTDRGMDRIGTAKFGATYSGDVPRADIIQKELARGIFPIIVGYGYSIQDLERSVRLQMPLDQGRAMSARESFEDKLEEVAAAGATALGIVGFASSASVPVIDKSELTGDWSMSTAAADLVDDCQIILDTVLTNTKGKRKPNTLVMPLAQWKVLNRKIFDTTSQKTVKTVVEESNPGLSIEYWDQLALKDSAGTGPRVVAYEKSPLVLTMVLPQDFSQLPPQPQNYEFFVPCHGRFGGVAWARPLAAVYADIAVA